MKKSIFFAVQIALLCLSSCGTTSLSTRPSTWNTAHHQSVIAQIVDRDTILIGTTGDYRPLSFCESDGSYWGFGIEVARAFASRLGVAT